MRFIGVGRFTWKNYGLSLYDLKYRTLPEDFFQYEEMMNIHNDYELADVKDSEVNS